MEIYSTIILVAATVVLLFVQRLKHKKELAELAKESSERIQEYHAKLVKVCTEPDSLEAKQIVHEVVFNVESEKSKWFGTPTKDEVPYNEKGIWAQIKEQEGGIN